jgi:hypothetical protein
MGLHRLKTEGLTHVLKLLGEFDGALPELDGIHAKNTCHKR